MIYRDFLEPLRVLANHKAKYAIIGGYAVGMHAEPRYPKDLDILVSPVPRNAKALLAALTQHGAPVANLSERELSTPGLL